MRAKMNELGQGIDRRAIALAAKTFGEVLDDYCKTRVDPQLDAPLCGITAGTYKRMAKHYLAERLDIPLKDINRKMILEKYESLLAAVKEREAARAKKAGCEPDPRKSGAGDRGRAGRPQCAANPPCQGCRSNIDAAHCRGPAGDHDGLTGSPN